VFTVAGKAIRGYDAVAYFAEGKSVKGNSKFVYSWAGSDWHFVSEAHLKAFQQDPEKYAPQYGGYCAYGMANGYKAPTDNDAWMIVDGKLYLNYNKDVQKMWKEKQNEYILAADKSWPQTKNKE
jgi:YHS domain-containing protein